MTRPGDVGDGAHLTVGSVRWSIARGVRIIVTTGGDSSGFYWDLVKGRDVVVTREQIEGFVSEYDRTLLGLDLGEHESFVLSGDSTLTPVT